ncbi:MAG: NADH-quinone oxidoreductase subunit H [Candidatus Omnitrophota bacterium]
MRTVFSILQIIMLIVIAPLVSGLITKIKNNVRLRRGQSVFQPYYNLAKLFSKEEVISEHTSWIFSVTPYVVFASTVTALFLVPTFIAKNPQGCMGDLFLLVFILSLGRFFLALAGLDSGSAFGGMGSSREMFISSFAEPAAILVFFAVSLSAGSTNLGAVTTGGFRLSWLVAAVSLLLVVLAETSRIPVDNQETHLELTMVHEAMILEYSGRSLALIELASYVKQIVFFSLLGAIVWPCMAAASAGYAEIIAALAAYLLKIAGLVLVVALVEVSLAKMRLFRVVDFLYFSFVIALVAVIAAVFGV